MSDIVRLRINAVKTLQAQVASAEAKLERDRQELAVRTKLLKQEIDKGGTTGDQLQDMVLKAGGGVDDPLLPKLRVLNDKLKGKKGEFVLVRYAAEDMIGFGATELHPALHFRVGLLAGDEVRLSAEQPASLGLPVKKYLQGVWPKSRVYTIYLDKEQVPFEGHFFEWASVEDQPPSLVEYLTEDHLAGSLIIGDEALKAELVGAQCEDFFARAAERLGRLVLQPT